MKNIPNKSQFVKLLLEVLTEKYGMRKPKKQKVKITKVKKQKNITRKPKKLREEENMDKVKTSPFQCDCEKMVGMRFKDYTCPKCNRLIKFDPKNPKPITPRKQR